MSTLKGSKTEANLQAAFAGESQARGKYTFFAAKARSEGYTRVAKFFDDAALNEQEHSKIWFKYLDGIGDTAANLKTAKEGEHYETTEMYVNFAKTAKEEGFDEIAKHFQQIASIEKAHETRFQKFLDNLAKEKVGGADSALWECKNCGNRVTAKQPPSPCPVCGNADIAWTGTKAYVQVEE